MADITLPVDREIFEETHLGAILDLYDIEANAKFDAELVGLLREGAVQPEAIFAPAVMFAIDSALSYLNHPEIQPGLPGEVAERAVVASILIKTEILPPSLVLFTKAYEQRGLGKIVSGTVSGNTQVSWAHEEWHLGMISEAPFIDTQALVGGAANKLASTNHGMLPDEVADRVINSRSLLAFAGVRKRDADIVKRRLNIFPYVAEEFLEINDDKTVGFTEEASEIIAEFSKGAGAWGCPLGRFSTEANADVFVQNWKSIASFLLSEGYTTDSDLGARPA